VIAGTRKKEDVITGSRQNAAGVIFFQINLLIINIFLDMLSILGCSPHFVRATEVPKV
jgi:hypothetical protein